MLRDWTVVDSGKWFVNALRNLPRCQGSWSGIPRRGYTFHLQGVQNGVAQIRCLKPGVWSAKIAGFEWRTVEGMGSYRFQKALGGFAFTPVKMFPSSEAAKREVERVLDGRPAAPEQAA